MCGLSDVFCIGWLDEVIGTNEAIHHDATVGKKEFKENIEVIRCVVSTSLVLIEVNWVIDRHDTVWIAWHTILISHIFLFHTATNV